MKRIAMTALAGLVAPMAMADEQRELGAHVHGVSQLELAVEGDQLTLALRAPGADITGFEHAAESAEDKAAVADALALLARSEAIFAFPEAAGCVLVEANAELEGEGAHDHDDHDHDDHDHEAHDHDEHDHDEHAHDDHDHDAHEHEDHDHDDHDHEGHEHDEHAHDDHDDHAHDDHAHDHGEEAHAGHSEFHAMYMYECSDAGALTEVAFPFFDSFPNAREIEAQYITDSGAGAAEVEADAAVLKLD